MIIKSKCIEYGDMKFEDLLPYVGKHCKVEFADDRTFDNVVVVLERRYTKFGVDDFIDVGVGWRNEIRLIRSIEECNENG